MFNIYNNDFNIDLEKHIFWQYNNAAAINSLIKQKQEWYKKNYSQFWDDWIRDVLTLATANDFGLSIWGILLQTPRTYLVNGVNTTLSTQQYRTLLIARIMLLSIKGTVPEINKLLNFLFAKYGKAYVVDNQNMTITYRFDFNLTELQLAVIQAIPLLPRPAGVKINIISLDNKVFGFNGSGMPFNQARFAQYLNF